MLPVHHCVDKIEANRDRIIGVKVRIGGHRHRRPRARRAGAGARGGERGGPAADVATSAIRRRAIRTWSTCCGRATSSPTATGPSRTRRSAPDGKVLDAVWQARERGVLFDIAHGMGAFGYETAEAALKDGFKPDLISSDVHVIAIEGPGFDLLHTMSKLLNCGLSLAEVIGMSTSRPALAIRRPDLGHLGVGASADITVLREVTVGLRLCRRGRRDAAGHRRCSTRSPATSAARRWRCRRGRSRRRTSSATSTIIITTTSLRRRMSYKAIYTYAWDLAEAGVPRGGRRVPRARARHRDDRRQLPRRQVHAAARQGREGLLPRGRHGLFQRRSLALRRRSSRSPTACSGAATCCAS